MGIKTHNFNEAVDELTEAAFQWFLFKFLPVKTTEGFDFSPTYQKISNEGREKSNSNNPKL
jgi:hypothetical protein